MITTRHGVTICVRETRIMGAVVDVENAIVDRRTRNHTNFLSAPCPLLLPREEQAGLFP